mgnify:CR=1 FL=1
MLPFWVFRERPGGSAGDTDHVGNVPVAVGASGDIAVLSVSDRLEGL